MTSVFNKIISLLPLLMFIAGLVLIVIASFLLNQIIGFFVCGLCLIVLAIIIGYKKGGD